MPVKTSTANAIRSATTRIDVSAAAAPTAGQVLTATSTTASTWQNTVGGPFLNSLVNSSFDVAQSGTTFTTPNDDTYILDNWNCLLDGNGSWTFSQSTDVPTTKSKYSLKAVNVTANKQCGIVQFLENIDAKKVIGQTVSLSFQAKTTTAKVISNLRATVLSWSSTADTITSDVVGTWAGAGTDPTWATNWTAEIAGSNKALTTTWTEYQINNIPIDTASTTNIGVVIWVDDTTITSGDEFFVTQIQQNVGPVALPYEPKQYVDELLKVRRLYHRCSADAVYTYYVTGQAASTTAAQGLFFVHPVKMRISPTLTTSGNIALTSANGGLIATTSITTDQGGTDSSSLLATVASGLVAGNATSLVSNNNTTSYIEFSARL